MDDFFKGFAPEELSGFSEEDVLKIQSENKQLAIDAEIFKMELYQQNAYFKKYLIANGYLEKVDFPGQTKVPVYAFKDWRDLRKTYSLDTLKALAKMNWALVQRKFEFTFFVAGILKETFEKNNLPTDVVFVCFRDDIKNKKVNSAVLKQFDYIKYIKGKFGN